MNEKPTVIKYVIGIDEVGRGPLAGPVTLCAFAVPQKYIKNFDLFGSKDSKKLSEQKRELIATELKHLAKHEKCFFTIASSSASIIDEQGLGRAIQKAVAQVLKKLEETLMIHPGNMDIYLDGGLRASIRYFRQHTIIYGDATVPVIACASILAKVHRDRLMNTYDREFPEYGFLNHKGYGTPEHYKAIKKHGITSIHRKLFLKGIKTRSEKNLT